MSVSSAIQHASWFGSIARSASIGAWVALLSCQVSTNPPAVCTQPQASFTVQIHRASTQELPSDLTVRVIYGGGVEEYRLEEANDGPVIFCEQITEEAIALATNLLKCDFWTDGPATLELESSSFDLLIEELMPDSKVCTRFLSIDLDAL